MILTCSAPFALLLVLISINHLHTVDWGTPCCLAYSLYLTLAPRAGI